MNRLARQMQMFPDGVLLWWRLVLIHGVELERAQLVTRLTEAATRVYADGSRIGCYVNPDEAATLLAALRPCPMT